MIIRCESDGRVLASITLGVPLPAITVWGQMRDFPGFATLDPFHDRIEVLRTTDRGGAMSAPSPGVAIRLHHRFGPFRLVRTGRILTWRKGQGYSFSDLSQRGVRVGFPHIYEYRVVPIGTDTSRLTVSVRGRWTANWIPMLLRRVWLAFVTSQIQAVLRVHFVRFRRFRQDHRRYAVDRQSEMAGR